MLTKSAESNVVDNRSAHKSLTGKWLNTRYDSTELFLERTRYDLTKKDDSTLVLFFYYTIAAD